jgi:hypothetical protein
MVISLRIAFVALVLGACAPLAEPATSNVTDGLTGGIEGANCAEVDPLMEGPDGVYDVNSMVRYHHRSEAAYRVSTEQGDVIQVVLPPGFQQLDPAFTIWGKKDAQNYQERDRLAFSANDFHPGKFNLLGDTPGMGCMNLLGDEQRDRASLYLTAEFQDRLCPKEHPTDPDRNWRVHPLFALELGDRIYRVSDLIAKGLAAQVTEARADRCILPDPWNAVVPIPTVGPIPIIPCQAAFVSSAVTEAVVFLVPSLATVAGLPLLSRPFTGRANVVLPNVDAMRTVLRSSDMSAVELDGMPRVEVIGPAEVRFAAYRIRPLEHPSPRLRPEELAWVTERAGRYGQVCCGCATSAPGASALGAPLATPGASAPGAPLADPACRVETPGFGATCSADLCFRTITAGLIVMVTAATVADCVARCPELASGPLPPTPECTL